MTKPAPTKPAQVKRRGAAKSAAQRATEALDIADRRVTKLTAERDRLKGELADYETALTQATARRDYAANNPDLPITNPTTTQED